MPYSSCRITRSCQHKALSCRPLGLPIEKDLAGPELPLPILRYPSHKSCQPQLSGGGKEHPRSEGWSFPCLFCGTQVIRGAGSSSCKKIKNIKKKYIFKKITRQANFAHFDGEEMPPLLRYVQRIARVPPQEFFCTLLRPAPPRILCMDLEGEGGCGAISRTLPTFSVPCLTF